jgi:hypothetical protein
MRLHEAAGLGAIIQGGKELCKLQSLAQSIDQVLALGFGCVLRFRIDFRDGLECLSGLEITHVLFKNEPQHAVGEGGKLQ